ncbi:site-specific DNA-methyltransferase [Vogesella sp. XCS3]|uniref:site-specific DNA-methyltransferase n=1 Tax=Vogesella sp. XCS3 TaxID=2877939 RepID=UPI001D0A05C2|nr:site-specific DNA-methyltransferase [Vogesella sp. XCS3]UDM18957.1 site-specific DNA-methyltransferase [Vogesella sp. XCS3]
MQLDLFSHVAAAYADAKVCLDNETLYSEVSRRAGLSNDELNARTPIGEAGALRSVVKRKIRWHQQELKAMGVITRHERGIWGLTEKVTEDLDRAKSGVKLVAFSTDLGVAVWGACRDVFGGLEQQIALCVTSPPYPLRIPRAYGNPSESEYTDFICRSFEPIIKNLMPGASVCINLSNDIFLPGVPARSLYLERLTIALCDRFGLYKMDMIPWVNLSKPPAPIAWASKKRVQLNTGYEPVLWLTNDPHKVRSNNRRVLEEHSERHKALLARGGEQRTAEYGDGAYKLRPGSFGGMTEGRIPKNVLMRGHVCRDGAQYKEDAERLGLPSHGAAFPLAIPDFLIRFLSEPEDLVVDPFGGTIKVGMAAERLGRRWMVSEWILQYIRASAERFRIFPGYWLNPMMAAM